MRLSIVGLAVRVFVEDRELRRDSLVILHLEKETNGGWVEDITLNHPNQQRIWATLSNVYFKLYSVWRVCDNGFVYYKWH